MSDEVTLDFLAAQQRHLLHEMSSLRTNFGVMQDDIRVLSAMAIRQDNTTKALIAQMDRSYHDLHQEMNGIRENMRRMQEQMEGMDARMQGMDERMQGMDERMQGMDERMRGIHEQLQGIDGRLASVEARIH